MFCVERTLAQALVLNGGFHGRFFGLILLFPRPKREKRGSRSHFVGAAVVFAVFAAKAAKWKGPFDSMPIFTLLLWLLLTWAAGWFAYPVALRLCGHALPDGGLALGRVAFLTLWTLAAFWAGQVGVPIAVGAWGWIPLGVAGSVAGWRNWAHVRRELQVRWRAVLGVEMVFLAVFLTFFALRGYWSDTNGNNGEKAMDSALIGTLARAQRLPPENPYAAGARLSSYYIFGHLETALLTRATGTTVRWSYNLECATLPALCASLLFSLGAGLTRRLDGGAFVAGTVLGLGTLQPIAQWLRPVDGLLARRALDPNIGLVKDLDFFAVSRPLPNAISEFPWFTFNQADLHAHYFDFPLEIALMALAWAIFRAQGEKHRRVLMALAGVLLGAQILTNTWDFPAYALAVGLSLLLAPRAKGVALGRGRVAPLIAALLGAVALALPYLLGINTAARTPTPLPQPASPLREWLLLWAPIIIGWTGFCAWRTFRFDARWRWALAMVAALVWAGAFFQAQWGYPPGLDAQPVPTSEALASWFAPLNPARLVLPFIAWSAFIAALGARYNRGVARFLPCLALAGLFALAWSETTWAGFLGDPNNPAFGDFKRQDTVFKFGLQTWILWGTAASAGAYLTLRRWPLPLRLAMVPLLLVMALSSFVDMLGRAHSFDPAQRQGWDAWAHLAPPEQEAATWLQSHTAPDENLLEAEQKEGGDYSVYTRYAHATGIATVIGPQAHTFQWSPNPTRVAPRPEETAQQFLDRKAGAQWDEVAKRKADARDAFTTPQADTRRALLAKYGVRYVVWGELERAQYGEAAHTLLARDLLPPARFGFDARDDPAHRVEIFRRP